MKKLKFLLLLPLLMLSGCNKQLFDTNFKFTKVHVFATNKCYEITSWTDYEDGDQIQVKIKDFGTSERPTNLSLANGGVVAIRRMVIASGADFNMSVDNKLKQSVFWKALFTLLMAS